MKKLMASASVALAMGCAFVLANANDDIDSNNAIQAMHQQEPGTAGDTSVNSNQGTSDQDKSQTSTTTTSTTSTKSHAMNKPSCTDDNGKVYLRGHAGYNTCVKATKTEPVGG